MVVEHIVQTHGPAALNAVLNDLNTGVQINDALDRHTGGLEALETSFRSFLTEQAKGWAAGVDFSKEAFAEAKPTDLESVKLFLETHPSSFSGLMTQASLLLQDNKLDEAEIALKKLVEQVPGSRRAFFGRATKEPKNSGKQAANPEDSHIRRIRYAGERFENTTLKVSACRF